MLRLPRTLIILAGLVAAGCATSRPGLDVLGARPGAFVAISVADLDRVLPFYRDTLGFRVYSQGVAPNRPVRYALLEQGNALLEILQLADAKPRATAAPGTTDAYQIHGFFKGGFVVDDIDVVYARMKRLDITLAYDLGRPPNGSYRSFGVRDPEGNLLQFFGR